MSCVIGIDLGSTTTKIVRLDDGTVTHSEIFRTGHEPLARVRESLERFGGDMIIATGYGRHLLAGQYGAHRITEIKACARGVFHLMPSCRTILDVGGQDCKVISLGDTGRVDDFEMNDRCAAGTGKFLEVMAHLFEMDIAGFTNLALEADSHARISSMCTVFAESEVVSLITSGIPREQIARGLHVAIADRLGVMLNRIHPKDDIVFVGGGALNECLVDLLAKRVRHTLHRPPDPQMVIALGAALIGSEARDDELD